MTRAWVVLGGLVTGLACELPVRGAESRVLRRERFAGLSIGAFVAAKATLMLPLLAVADVLILVIPALAGRLQAGYGMSFLAVFVASIVGLAAATVTLLPRSARLPTGWL